MARKLKLRRHKEFPEGDIGSDVEGPKPIMFELFDGDDQQMKKALAECKEYLGNNATILCYDTEEIAKRWQKEAGGSWECYHADNFYGWEADRVLAIISSLSTMKIVEILSRAKTHLAVIYVKLHPKSINVAKIFRQAADAGLIVHQNAEAAFCAP